MSFEVRWHSPAWIFFLPSIEAGQITFEAHYSGDPSQGNPQWLLKAEAWSSGALASFTGMKVRDTFESWMDAKDFCSLRILKRVREGSRQRDIDVVFHRQTQSLGISETDLSKTPVRVMRQEEIQDIPPCVQDVLSAFYAVRSLPLEVGKDYSFQLSENGRTKTIQGFVEKEEKVETEIGSLPALKVRTQSLFGGLFREGGEFYLWLHKERKYPVRFEAKVKIGRVFGRITSYQQK